jgi:AraC family transcriptional regulator
MLPEPKSLRQEPLQRKLSGVTAVVHAGSNLDPRMHSHDHPLISLLLQGTMREVDQTRSLECGPFSLHLQSPGYMHSHEIKSKEAMSLCAIFLPEFLSRIAASPRALEIPSIYDSGPVIEVGLRIYREMWANDDASDLVLEGLFIQLVGEMDRAGCPKELLPPPWLEETKDLLNDRYLDGLSLVQIADEIGVHPSHLSRTFRRHFGQTLGEYVRCLRIDHAIRQLASTDSPISHIAAAAGFSDHAHFSRECKKRLGMTPVELRRSVRMR